jgi:hypothetical protein
VQAWKQQGCIEKGFRRLNNSEKVRGGNTSSGCRINRICRMAVTRCIGDLEGRGKI